MDRLRTIQTHPEIPDDVQQVIDHFLVRINPDQQLPIQADLIGDARWLKNRLLG